MTGPTSMYWCMTHVFQQPNIAMYTYRWFYLIFSIFRRIILVKYHKTFKLTILNRCHGSIPYIISIKQQYYVLIVCSCCGNTCKVVRYWSLRPCIILMHWLKRWRLAGEMSVWKITAKEELFFLYTNLYFILCIFYLARQFKSWLNLSFNYLT